MTQNLEKLVSDVDTLKDDLLIKMIEALALAMKQLTEVIAELKARVEALEEGRK